MSESSKCALKDHRFVQLYRTEWETLPIFRGWLAPVPGNKYRALCTYCNKQFRAHRTDLRTHAKTKKHQNARIVPAEPLNEGFPNEQDVTLKSKNEDSSSEDETLHINRPTGRCPSIEDATSVSNVVLELAAANGESNSVAAKVAVQLASYENPSPLPRTHWDSLAEAMRHNPAHCQEGESPSVSTQVLDMVQGTPVEHLRVKLMVHCVDEWIELSEDITDVDGRCSNFIRQDELVAGRYRLHFDVKKYFTLGLRDTALPFVEVTFDVSEPGERFHVTLLLSPVGYMICLQT